jgi:hypothetical protein
MMPHRMFVERYRRFVRDGALPVPRKVVFPPEAAVWRECAELVVGLMPTNPEHLQVVAPRCSLHALAFGDVAVELVLFRARWQACRYRFLCRRLRPCVCLLRRGISCKSSHGFLSCCADHP